MPRRSRRSRFVLLTQDPQRIAEVTAALQDLGEVVPVREATPLPALLDRGAGLVLTDLGLPDRTLQAAAEDLADRRELPIVVLAAGSTDTWDGLSRGSPLEKTLQAPVDADTLRRVVADLLERSRFLHENLVGQSPAMQEVREQILLVGPTPVTVLIAGESGTGKDVVARALHHYSGRQDRPFKPINCAAIPENLLENELFGHEKGAFTDARAQTRGIFEQADGGTVFLDEIGEMSLSAQVRLLRVLEERCVTRIGGDRSLPVDVRVLAASNKDLLAAVAAGEFRRDLYYRLKVVALRLPPLRERRSDIPLLLEHWVEIVTRSNHGARFEGFSPAALELLVDYDWPGNVRELRNLVEHLVFLGPRHQVQPEDVVRHLEAPAAAVGRHLPVPTHKTPDQSERELIYFALLDLKREVAAVRHLLESSPPDPVPPAARPVFTDQEDEAHVAQIEGEEVPSLKELEREAIVRALEQVGNNRRRAAEILGIGERTLYRKLEEYGLR